MRFPSMLRRLRNTQGGMGSTAKSTSTPYTPEPSTLEVRVFGNPQTVSVGAPVKFIGSVSNAPANATLTYSWDFGEGATDIKGPDGLTPSCKYKTPGDKTVTLTVSYTDTNGNLVEAYNSVTIKVDPCLSLPGETEPPWLTEARTYLGLRESDAGERAELKKLFKFGGFDLNPAKTPWCAAFVGSVLGKRGLGHTGSNGSQSYRTWGDPCEERVGAVVVFKSHVGFVSSPGMVLGGNQTHEVNILEQDEFFDKEDPKDRPIYRCPRECSSSDEANESDETDESGETSE